VDDVTHGSVLITLAIDTSSTNNTVLNMDYRFDPPRWSHWPAVSAECLASVVDMTRGGRQTPFIGDTDGFVRRTNTANRSIDETTAINYKVTLPFLDFGNPVSKKTFARGAVGIEPKGAYNGTFGWSRDDNAQQTTTFSQGGGDVLAGSATSGSITGHSQDGSGTITFAAAGHTLTVDDIVAVSGTFTLNGVYTVTGVVAGTSFDVAAPNQLVLNQSGTWATSTTANFFTLGTSTLAGSQFVDRFFSLEEGGEFRSIQYQITQTGLNEDIAIHSLFAEVEPGADSTENN
jgi:hypothetical protein